VIVYSRIETLIVRHARLRGFYMDGCCVEAGIAGDRLHCEGGVFLRNGFRATGEVRLLGAEIGGDLDCSGGTFDHAGGNALSCDGAKVTGDLSLRNGFRATGEVRLLSAEIGGALDCSGGTFDHAGGNALACDGAKVTGNVFLSTGFRATGAVRLHGAEIGSDLSCSGGTFDHAGGNALSCDRAKVTGGVLLNDGFRATGAVRLPGAEIGGDLVCSGGTFDHAGGDALFCQSTKVTGGFLFRALKTMAGGVSLSSCRVGTLVDDPASWAGANGRLVLDGFVYGRIDGDPAFVDAAQRIAWLQSQRPDHLATEFRPQPWEQLIKVLRETGHPNAVRKVAIAKQEQMRVAGRFAGIRRPIHRLYGAFVGYGYRPERLLYAMSALWLGFGLVFLWGSADHVGRIAPGPTLFLNAPEPRDVPRHSPLHDFDPWRWSLDALLPIDLGYTATAHPDEARWQGRVLGWMAVFETLFGWIASLLLVASVTNLLKKD